MNEELKGTAKGAMEKIEAEVTAGLRHGHFEISLKGEIIKGQKRSLLLKAGKSHKFIINEEDLN
jgi:hypothetical protein